MASPANRRYLLAGVAAAVLAIPTIAQTVNRTEQPYVVRMSAGGDLRQALNAASPIRDHGEIFHGRTDWDVRTHYRWWREADGRCRITESRVELSIAMILPLLEPDAPVAVTRRFDAYLARLREHEEGHVRIARETAFAIESRIRSLPQERDCDSLQRSADAARAQLLEDGQARQQRYDRDTGHGVSQGARLD